MTQFDDGLDAAEVTKKNLLGTVYFLIALFGVCLNLATLTVLPECEKTLTKPLFILFCSQLFTNIASLISIGVPIPYMIASNKPYFLNVILLRGPGTMLAITLILSFSMQFWICIYRNSSIVFPRLTYYMFSDIVVHLLHFITFVFTINQVVDLTNRTEIRTFDITLLTWIQTEHEYLTLLSIVVYAGMVCIMFYGLAFFDLLYKHLYHEYDEQDLQTPRPLRQMLNQLLHLICDIIFGFLLVMPPVPPISHFSITHSLVTIYGTILWPTISLIVYSEHIRRELCFRVIMMTRTGQMAGQDQCQSRRGNDNRFRFL